MASELTRDDRWRLEIEASDKIEVLVIMRDDLSTLKGTWFWLPAGKTVGDLVNLREAVSTRKIETLQKRCESYRRAGEPYGD